MGQRREALNPAVQDVRQMGLRATQKARSFEQRQQFRLSAWVVRLHVVTHFC